MSSSELSRTSVGGGCGAEASAPAPRGLAVVPSIASCDQARIADEVSRLGSGYPNLHVDVEDGNFVPNITFGMRTVRAVRACTPKPFSAHLMVTEPLDYIDELCSLGCSHLFFHAEATQYVRRCLNRIRSHGVRAGIALNPVSDVRTYEYLLGDCDAILYMTSEPDGAGEEFQEAVTRKIRRYPGVETWVDGGVRMGMLPCLADIGVDVVVMGREVFGAEDPSALLTSLNS